MDEFEVDWSKAPVWAHWAVRETNGITWFRDRPPHRTSLTRRPQTVTIHQDNDGAGMLRAQIGHLLEDMTPEQLDALYAHVRKQLDAAKFDELNRQLGKSFGGVPREWQLKAFEAFLDGHSVFNLHASGTHYTGGAYPTWAPGERYRIEPKQS